MAAISMGKPVAGPSPLSADRDTIFGVGSLASLPCCSTWPENDSIQAQGIQKKIRVWKLLILGASNSQIHETPFPLICRMVNEMYPSAGSVSWMRDVHSSKSMALLGHWCGASQDDMAL